MQALTINILGPVTLPEFPREFHDTMTKFGVFRAFIAAHGLTSAVTCPLSHQ